MTEKKGLRSVFASVGSELLDGFKDINDRLDAILERLKLAIDFHNMDSLHKLKNIAFEVRRAA